jgi:very-short-patch-repair endonuclease
MKESGRHQKDMLPVTARKLRRRSTEAEKALWRRLRNRQLDGFKFRRQQIIGAYIVDFVSLEDKFVIEVDGGQHAWEKDKDRERDGWLQEQGFRVLRFWNNDVLENLEGVLERIEALLLTGAQPPPG